ncbi:MAG TPA: condensation domain-containing protein [Myxococcaceae bacterium]|nr:condensation domain-containing protein [Myxococcaceae bacterium]
MSVQRGRGELSETKRRLLEQLVRGSPEAERRGSLVRGYAEEAPLSPEQDLIWIHSHLAPQLPLYNEILTVRRLGPLDVPALERALSEVVRRHEAWRTTFEDTADGARQRVRPAGAIALPSIDLSRFPAPERELEAQRLASAEALEPLDVFNGPVMRATLVHMGGEEHRLYVVVHQIVHDGISVYSVFLPELVELYEAYAAGRTSSLPELPVQYADYAAWVSRRLQENPPTASLEWWRRTLAGAPEALELPTDHARPSAQSFRGGQETFALGKSLTRSLERLSQGEGATLFATLLTAFKVLLLRYSGEEDLVVGTAVSTRKRPEVEKLLGVFLNTIALRTRIEEGLTFQDALARVQQTVVDGVSHGDVPFHLLVKELHPRRDPSRNPIFQATFVLEPPMPPPRPGWNMTQMDVGTGVARVDLYMQMDHRPEGLVGHVRYNADLWERSTMASMVEHFVRLLAGIVENPGAAVGALPMLAPTESEEARNESGSVEMPELEQSLARRFEEQVAARPKAVAVRDGRGQMTYAQLDRAANQVARALSSPGRVAVLANQDAAMVAALLGVLKAGGAYVPLDPTHPTERLQQIVSDAGASTLLASRQHLPLAGLLL